jgi:glycosyltransferase involved in cell wall biosynthesis
MRTSAILPWKEGLGGGTDNHYFDDWPNRLRLVRTFLFSPSGKFMVIGYANFGSRFLLLASWILKRDFLYWTDEPEDRERSFLRTRVRNVFLHIVKRRGNPIFVVGKRTIAKFERMGFPRDRLVNLPIFIDLQPAGSMPPGDAAAIRGRYGVRLDEVLFVAASRLAFNKGYDLLVEAVSRISPGVLERLKVLIVGAGPEKENLHALVRRKRLGERVLFEDWLEPEAYERVLRAADVLVHPARFDAFGGGTLFAMALGVPVIGSEGAGAAKERVEHGVNGLLYPAEDTDALAHAIVRLVNDPAERRRMGGEARATAEKWPPTLGAEIIHNCLKGSFPREEP